jgi:hypothetical protein
MSTRTHRDNVLRITIARILSMALAAAVAQQAVPVAEAACTSSPDGVVTCTGQLTNGVLSGRDFSSPPVYRLVLRDVTSTIAPVSGYAIHFRNAAGGDIRIEILPQPVPVSIVTTHANARGINAESVGTPPNPPESARDRFLGVFLLDDPDDPDAPAGVVIPGGRVDIDSHADVTTSGAGAHGISVTSSSTGYGSAVTDPYAAFDADSFEWVVRSLRQPGTDGEAGELEVAIAGVLVAEDGTVLRDDEGQARTAGTFILHADGTFSFEPDESLEDLELDEDEFVRVAVDYTLTGRNAQGDEQDEDARLVVNYRGTADGTVEQVRETHFTRYGVSDWANEIPDDPDWTPTLIPDLQRFIARQQAIAAAGSGGGSVYVTSGGKLTTVGDGAHGINAISNGSNGAAGRNGSMFRSATAGQPGKDGGTVVVTANGTISTGATIGTTTVGRESVGVLAVSRGGDGGHGGEGGTWRYGQAGGEAGDGGDVFVLGDGTIDTDGESAVGILAVSVGGNGGGGGSGSFVTGGASGGFGGQAGTVTVDGRWDITTLGVNAHAIWAKAVGGNAGGGGSGGWLWGDSGGGGRASDGGTVHVTSGGDLVTSGRDAYGILAQSIGGFGGSGGGGFSLFYSAGGNGSSAGSGSEVTVEQTAGGTIATGGAGAHGILAQSIGGGGGSGGGTSGFIAAGGDAGAGGHGGSVHVTNAGSITTGGVAAYGILAESIGGGGGDGGSSKGAGGIGGAASGGGRGESVTVFNAAGGDITASGAESIGIMAQSVGGGGGNGGTSSGLVAIGGSGSATSNGGAVRIENAGDVVATSYGLFAQSIGGGGGNGGSSTGWFSFGGRGGGGGAGLAVDVINSGSLTTREDNASALFAQSVGGGGGNGGNSIAVGLLTSVAIGGSAGAGGAGGAVTVDSTAGQIITDGDRSRGIVAQSVGGGGGSGGYAFSGAVGPGVSITVGLGGKGGGGGGAGAVVLGSHSDITTHGEDAHGILAQSVGGGGGSGGFAISLSGSDGIAAAFGMGGKGGTGGSGNTVTLGSAEDALRGSIRTDGAHSYGILAQSVGGGGGDGGFSIAASVAGGVSASLSFGGNAGVGGIGRDVKVWSANDITTVQADSHGLFAQSVGGGGGSGGFSVKGGLGGSADLGASFGGAGGAGAAAGEVAVHTRGTLISTSGEHSYGVLAQSIGGSGGDGGFSVAGGISASANVNFAMGGSGGAGAEGKDVTLTNSSTVNTVGSDSHGLFAQSVGGGGGSGGFSVAGGISASSAQVGVSIGGAGGGGARSGNVTLTTTGQTVGTEGDRSYGVLAQSIGGSGGNGGFSVAGGISSSASVNFAMGGGGGGGAVAGEVKLTNSSTVTTAGSDAHGLFAQSVGGGGGSGGFSVTGGISASSAQVGASIGGRGGGGSSTSQVTLVTTGELISTSGDRSYGALAQSVGGSGGDGGFSVAGGISASPSVNFAMGGRGGAASTGGEVDLTSSSSVYTSGAASHGLFAQSVGGGGGSGGFAVAGGLSANSVQVGVSLGGPGGAGGNASRVDLGSSGEFVVTEGDRAFGLLAQSVGGGGGDGGFSVAGGMGSKGSVEFAMGGRGGVAGTGDEVGLVNASTILTGGDFAHGIVAQSVGGGGGSGGFALTGSLGTGDQSRQVSVSVGGGGGAGGDAGEVTASHSGAIETLGERAYGLLVQSVGGGGGDGGFARVMNAVEESDAPELPVDPDDPDKDEPKSVSFGITVGVGGNGAKAGAGSTARLTSTGDVTTHGTGSHALFVQSVGGGGGIGGFSATDGSGGNGEIGIEIGFSLGGMGGLGGGAGLVEVTSGGTLVTLGAGAHGIVAQSIGGGGGAGGASVSASEAPNEDAKVAVNVNASIGGTGGVAGDGGEVKVTNAGSIDTWGASAYGVFAQSVGGGGGDGGHSLVAIGDEDDEDGDESSSPLDDLAGGDDESSRETWSVGLTIGAGGEGGAAGTGNLVTLVNTGQVVTRGAGSHALFAQSVGGGGGVGGTTASRGGGGSGNVAIQFGFALGGSGGGGGSASLVTVSNDGTLLTLGDEAHGIVAQSVGGGGGAAGGALSSGSSASADEQVSINLNIAIGGSGAVAGDGGSVDVDSTGWIETAGRGAYGILAQSIGGGGGHGGLSTALAGGSDESLVNLGIGVGGGGGGGGHGSTVDVDSSGRLITWGAESIGIFAQSVGGGGGTGGTAIVQGGGARWGALDVGVGGSGGSGNYGGPVTVNNGGDLDTFGFASHGIFAQSIGGGGGRGGLTQTVNTGGDDADDPDSGNGLKLGVSVGGSGAGASDGGRVTITNGGLIHTRGEGAYGVLGQSVGGGGGEGGYGGYAGDDDDTQDKPFEWPSLELQVTLGGSAGSGGRGGDVEYSGAGSVLTEGRGAVGVLAQSVGGGGGLGGFGLAASTASIALGGAGGAGGAGGQVDLSIDGGIETFGDSAYAILAQSIGGGGGAAGDVAAGLSPTEGFGLGVAFGRAGGGGGDGGAVTIATSGDIVTHGAGATGIFAQSVGGGGGLGGSAVGLLPFAGSVGGEGAGGQVTVAHSGDILTEGAGAHGIVAQSAGGTLRGAAVDVTVGGTVATFGDDASGVLLQSVGGAGGDTLRLELQAGGRIYGGGGLGAGVAFLDGSASELVNRGIVGSVHGLDGLAIVGGTGDETVRNHGTVFGRVDLGGGANVFENLAGAVLASGTTVDLGSGGVLLNAGILSPGGAGMFMTSLIVGDLVNGATAEHLFEIDMTNRLADGLVVVGDFTAGGTVNLEFVGPVTARNQAYALISSQGRVIGDALQLGSHALPAAMTVDLAFRDGAAWLDLVPDFSLSGLTLNGNLGALGRHLNAVVEKGPGDAMQSFLDGVMVLASDDGVNVVLDQLQPASFTALPATSITAQARFNDALLSCRPLDGERRFNGESDCAWVRVAAWDHDQDETAAAHGFEQQAFEVSTGVQKGVGEGGRWYVGMGVGVEDSSTEAGPWTDSDGSLVQLGGVLKGVFGPASMAVSASAGSGSYDTRRRVPYLGEFAVARSEQDLTLYSADLRVAIGGSPSRQ